MPALPVCLTVTQCSACMYVCLRAWIYLCRHAGMRSCMYVHMCVTKVCTYMMQVRPSPPPPPSPPQWLVAPQACCFALFPSAPPVVWCGLVWLCPRCLARFPSPPPPVVWCGCARGPAPNIIMMMMMMMMIIIIIIINGWYPLKPAVLRGSLPPPPPPWCGVAAPPCSPLCCGVVCPRPGPYSSNVNTFRWEVSTVTRIGCV